MPHPEPLVVAYLHQESTQETENHAVNHSHAEAPKQYLRDGWQCQGGIGILTQGLSYKVFYQAVVKGK